MAYNSGSKLPGERASKLGHLSVVQSEWVKSLIEEFESLAPDTEDPSATMWTPFSSSAAPLKNVWAVDGSFVKVTGSGKPQKEVAFIKTAILSVDKSKLDKIDPENPHPLLLKDILSDSALFHATVLPLRNIRTPKGNNKDTVRNIIFDSMRIDEGGQYFETLKWLAFKKWRGPGQGANSPSFECPHCGEKIESGIEYDQDIDSCSYCVREVFLTDMIGFHLDMSEDSAPDTVASSYMLIMENIMLFTLIRLLWEHRDSKRVSDTLFIKDGPLLLGSQYSKLIPNIREFLQHAKDIGRPIHVIGQEKSGTFHDHLSGIAKFAPPFEKEEPLHFAVLSHDYVRNEVYRSPDLANPYGKRTNWGEKLFVKLDPGTHLMLNVPTGNYNESGSFPTQSDLIGLDRILATLPQLISRKFEGALYPIELANGVASMSSYPSAKILERFLDDTGNK
jgi:hypothetical protein